MTFNLRLLESTRNDHDPYRKYAVPPRKRFTTKEDDKQSGVAPLRIQIRTEA